MCRKISPLIMAIIILVVISGCVLWWTSSAHFFTNNDDVLVQEPSIPLNHGDNYWKTTVEAAELARNSGITELTPPTGLEAHVESKQRLQTLPSIPADMPFPEDLKSREELQKSECVSKLYNFLLSLDKSVSPHVNMVFGDSQHTNVILNWIIAAMLRLEPPLHNVMVISLDHLLCDTLTAKKLPLTCIAVSVECIFVSSIYIGSQLGWEKRMMVRHPVLRLINYWGYDVATYDSDAVLLRNPQPLYDERPHVSVLASVTNWPPEQAREWGFVVCPGVLVLRSSPSIETLWSHMHSVTMSEPDDQISWNTALKNMGVKWNKTTDVKKMCSEKIGWESEGTLKMFVFPEEKICRHCCKQTNKAFYIMHPVGGHHVMTTKEKVLKERNIWFMKSSWRDFNDTAMTGVKWLRKLSTL